MTTHGPEPDWLGRVDRWNPVPRLGGRCPGHAGCAGGTRRPVGQRGAGDPLVRRMGRCAHRLLRGAASDGRGAFPGAGGRVPGGRGGDARDRVRAGWPGDRPRAGRPHPCAGAVPAVEPGVPARPVLRRVAAGGRSQPRRSCDRARWRGDRNPLDDRCARPVHRRRLAGRVLYRAWPGDGGARDVEPGPARAGAQAARAHRAGRVGAAGCPGGARADRPGDARHRGPLARGYRAAGRGRRVRRRAGSGPGRADPADDRRHRAGRAGRHARPARRAARSGQRRRRRAAADAGRPAAAGRRRAGHWP